MHHSSHTKQETIKFSIITPILDGERFIGEYVASLLSQTHRNWEALIIDDGSSDLSIRIFESVTKSDSRFKLIINDLPKQISGPYQARNKGLSIASGEFICFLDIDDRWLPEKLERQAKFIADNPEIHLFYASYFRKDASQPIGVVRSKVPYLGEKLIIHFSNPIPMLTACISHEATRGVSFEAINHEDYVYWFRILARLSSSQIFFDKHPSAIYTIHPLSLSSNKLLALSWTINCYSLIGHAKPMKFLALICHIMHQTVVKVLDVITRWLHH
jgi:teichuronic acid biosynthesis glycosyltransferase TuaG